MQFIDEEGNLFGRINIIDALAVLLIVAVLVAGIAVLGLFSPSESDTRYATVDLGTQPDFVIEAVEEGDVMELENSADNITITDTQVAPGDRLLIRAEVNGQREILDEESDRSQFLFNDDPFVLGTNVNITTSEYQVDGPAIRIDRDGDSLTVQQTSVVVTTTVSPGVAEELSVGDTYTVAGESVATIESLDIYEAGDEARFVLAGLELTTVSRGDNQFYGQTPLLIGNTIDFETDAYTFSSELQHRGTVDLVADETTVVVTDTIPVEALETIQPGDSFEVADQEIATLESIRAFPTADREVAVVAAELSIRTREEAGERRFGERSIRFGSTIPFQTSEYELSGTIEQRDQSLDSSINEHRQVVIETNVDAAIEETISVGDTYEVAGESVAEIVSKTVYPTPDPTTKRLVLGIETITRTAAGAELFGDREIRTGTTMPFRTSEYDISGEILRSDTTEEPGEPTATTVTMQVENIRPERADRIEAGMTETIEDETLATITTVSDQPAEIITESEDGEIFLREHPRNRDLDLTVELETRDTGTEFRFHGDILREGDTIALDLGRITITGEVTVIGD